MRDRFVSDITSLQPICSDIGIIVSEIIKAITLDESPPPPKRDPTSKKPLPTPKKENRSPEKKSVEADESRCLTYALRMLYVC